MYRAAVALRPSLRFAYFERVWKDNRDGHGETKRAEGSDQAFVQSVSCEASYVDCATIISEPGASSMSLANGLGLGGRVCRRG